MEEVKAINGKNSAQKIKGRKGRIPEFLKPLFWEVDFYKLEFPKKQDFIIRRILEYGDKKAIYWMKQNLDKNAIKDVLCKTKGLSPRSANYWAVVLGINKREVMCLQKHYLKIRRKHWPY
jgi:hypothetical protein